MCQHPDPNLRECSCRGLGSCPEQTVLQEAKVTKPSLSEDLSPQHENFQESLSDLGVDQAQGCDRADPQNSLSSRPTSQLSEISSTEISS